MNIANPDMRTLIATKDWSKNALGDPRSWPLTLRILVDTILAQQTPAIILWGAGLTQIYNDAFAQTLGNRHPDALGQPTYECWPEITHTRAIHQRVLNGESVQIENLSVPVKREGGTEETFFSVSYSPLKDERGQIAGILAIVSEITERVKSEQARSQHEAEKLRLAEQKQLALEAAELGWWHFDATTREIFWDDRIREICGLDAREKLITYEKILALTHPEDRESVHEAVQFALQADNHKPYFIQYRIIRPDGEIRWIQSKGLTHFSPEKVDRRPVLFFGTVADITEEKIAEAKIKENAEKLALALAAGDLGGWEWDPETDLMMVSDRAAEIYGVAKDVPMTRTMMRSLLHEDFRAAAKVAAEQAVATKSDYNIEYRINKADGSSLWIAAKGRGVYDKTGKLKRMIGFVQDITERKNGELLREQLLIQERNARSEAERASRMKDEFLATLSHELRTPLNAILGWSQLLLRGNRSSREIESGLHTIERNARLQTQLISDLLDMSRIISGKIVLETEPIVPAKTVEDAIETVLPSAAKKEILIIKNVDFNAGIIKADPARLQQIVWNLLVNAVKFTPKGGTIEVVLKQNRDCVSIAVIDNGQGIEPQLLPHIFERFKQGDSSITRAHGGLGLGLSIVKQLTELHGGSLVVQSEGAGLGSSFEVLLPVLRTQDTDKAYTVASDTEGLFTSALHIDLAGMTILVVDDEQDGQELMRTLLRECNAEVITASSAHEALEIIARRNPDILLSDIGMPHVDGYQLLQKLRSLDGEKSRTLRAIALTAFARPSDRRKALEAGYMAHVTKPVNRLELMNALTQVMKTQDDLVP